MSVTTQAALLKAPYQIELIERKLTVEPDEVIVRNHLVGICGSDKSFFKGQLPPQTAEFRQEPKFPFHLGHESGGTVVEVGTKVREFQLGDHVMCFGWNNNFAQYFKAKVWELQAAPKGLDLDLVSLGEPISCAMYSGLNSGTNIGDVTVVMGGGFAGQLIAQCAKKQGAATVVVADVDDAKLAVARRLGADVIINTKKENAVEVVKALTDGVGADVVVEAAGSESSFNMASEMIKHNGVFVFYSWVTTPIKLDISRWHDDGLTFRNTCLVHHTRQQREVWTPWALRPVVKGLVDVKSLITHEFKLEEIAKAFDTAVKDDSAIKIVLRPQ
jgi:L-iditol 2-dehydrogenase